MIALCLEHHKKADVGTYTKDQLLALKKKGAPGVKPAFVVSGKGLGSVRYVKGLATASKKAAPASGKRTPKQDLEVKVERLAQIRRNAYAEKVREKLEAWAKTASPKASDLCRFIAAYGLRHHGLEGWKARHQATVDKKFTPKILKMLQPNIDATLRAGNQHRFDEAVAVMVNILGEDPAALEKEIAQEHPESAALQKARAAVVPAKKVAARKKPAKKKATKKKATRKKAKA